MDTPADKVVIDTTLNVPKPAVSCVTPTDHYDTTESNGEKYSR